MMGAQFTQISRKNVSRKVGLPASASILYSGDQGQLKTLKASLVRLNWLDSWSSHSADCHASRAGAVYRRLLPTSLLQTVCSKKVDARINFISSRV